MQFDLYILASRYTYTLFSTNGTRTLFLACSSIGMLKFILAYLLLP